MAFLQIFANTTISFVQVLILSTSIYLIHTTCKFINVFLAEIFVISSFFFFILNRLNSIDFNIAIILSILLSILVSLLSFFVLKSFLKPGQSLLAMIAALALGQFSQALMIISIGAEGKFLTKNILESVNFNLFTMTTPNVIAVLFGIIMSIVGLIFINFLPFGRTLKAISEHPETAICLGVNRFKVQLFIYLIASTICIISGLIFSFGNSFTPTSGFNFFIVAFLAFLMGGSSNLKAIYSSAFILTFIPEFFTILTFNGFSFGPATKTIFVFIVALISISLFPKGIFTRQKRQI